MNRIIVCLSIIASVGALLFCLLPSLLIAFGLGAAMTNLVTSGPQRFFAISALLFGLAGFFQYRSRNAPCPTDPKLAKVCGSARLWSKWILIFSITLWLIGAFFVFIAPMIF